MQLSLKTKQCRFFRPVSDNDVALYFGQAEDGLPRARCGHRNKLSCDVVYESIGLRLKEVDGTVKAKISKFSSRKTRKSGFYQQK